MDFDVIPKHVPKPKSVPELSKKEAVNHPAHYGGEDNPYEVIKVIRAWGLGFCLGNAVKYISRAGKKDPTKEIEDLEKARWYLDEHIKQRKVEKEIDQIVDDNYK